MKVFKFNPATGQRGEQIDNVRRASWASSRDNEYSGAAPAGFGKDAEVTVHHDSGITDREGNDVSYKRDEWICYCLGCWQMGVGPDGRPEEHWEWVVIGPVGGAS